MVVALEAAEEGPRGIVGVSMKRWFSRHRGGDVQVGSGPGRRV